MKNIAISASKTTIFIGMLISIYFAKKVNAQTNSYYSYKINGSLNILLDTTHYIKTIPKEDLLKIDSITIANSSYKITSFMTSVLYKSDPNNPLIDIMSNDNRIPPILKSGFQKCKTGDKILIERIVATNKRNKKSALESIIYTVE